MKKDNSNGICRYFQNLSAWTARPEVHIMNEPIKPKDWRPDCIDYKIDTDKRWTNFEIDLFKLKTLFAFDNSGSITGNELYFNEIKRLVQKYYKPGDKFYLWGSTYSEQTKSQIDQWINNKIGQEGTKCVNIAKLANENPNHREHLIIVTDGSVNSSDIDDVIDF